jgi:hypothetical protein
MRLKMGRKKLEYYPIKSGMKRKGMQGAEANFLERIHCSKEGKARPK